MAPRYVACLVVCLVAFSITLILSGSNLAAEKIYDQLGMRDQIPLLTRFSLNLSRFMLPWGTVLGVTVIAGLATGAWKARSKRGLLGVTLGCIGWAFFFGFLSAMLWMPIRQLEESMRQ